MTNTSKDKAASSRCKVKDYKPSPAQRVAGNYPKLFLTPQKLKITVENPAGSYREGFDGSGKAWRNYLKYDYGFVASGALGADGDKVDIFLGPKAYYSPVVHIVDQINSDGSFDEHKCMLGWDTQAEARKAYLSAYDKGWKGCGDITTVSMKAFKKWVKSGDTSPLSPLVKKAMATTKSKEELKELLFHGSTYKASVKRMLKRLVRMDAKEQEQYLDWVGETNPKLHEELLRDKELLKHQLAKRASRYSKPASVIRGQLRNILKNIWANTSQETGSLLRMRAAAELGVPDHVLGSKLVNFAFNPFAKPTAEMEHIIRTIAKGRHFGDMNQRRLLKTHPFSAKASDELVDINAGTTLEAIKQLMAGKRSTFWVSQDPKNRANMYAANLAAHTYSQPAILNAKIQAKYLRSPGTNAGYEALLTPDSIKHLRNVDIQTPGHLIQDVLRQYGTP